MITRRGFIGAAAAGLASLNGLRRSVLGSVDPVDPSIAEFRDLFVRFGGIDDFSIRLIGVDGRELSCYGYAAKKLDFRRAYWKEDTAMTLVFPAVMWRRIGPGIATASGLRRRQGGFMVLSEFERPIHFSPIDIIDCDPILSVT